MLTNTALLFFTRTATSEAVHKAVVKGQHINRKFSWLLINNTRKIARATGLTVYEINEHQQVGDEFGEKLSNAMEAVFNEGFENIIVIGNDCPQLTPAVITNAALQLTNQQLILGPDNHGGVYLLGISKQIFNKQQIASLQWQTVHLLHDLVSSIKTTSYCVLPALKDVNSSSDLLIVKNVLSSYGKIRSFILSIIASLNKNDHQTCFTYTSLFFFAKGLRAPPGNI